MQEKFWESKVQKCQWPPTLLDTHLKKMYTLFFFFLTKLNLWPRLLFHSRRYLFSQVQVDQVDSTSGQNAIGLRFSSSPPCLGWHQGASELTGHLRIGPDIWSSSGNCLHRSQLRFTQFQLVLRCCCSSLKCLSLHLASQPYVYITPTTNYLLD